MFRNARVVVREGIYSSCDQMAELVNSDDLMEKGEMINKVDKGKAATEGPASPLSSTTTTTSDLSKAPIESQSGELHSNVTVIRCSI